MRVLYISYTGLLEPLGQSQVLAYLRHLAASHDIDLVSFEKPADWADNGHRAAIQREASEAGIAWHPQVYHKRPALASTAYDLARGVAVARRVVRQRDVEVVHARGYVPGVIASLVQRPGVRFLFDMRGFWADERVDAGAWGADSAMYKLVKRIEQSLLTRADAVVSLTEAAAEAIRDFEYIRYRGVHVDVIPTCADLDRFHPPPSPPTGPFTLGYVGNVAGGYRFEPVAEAFAAIREAEPEARLLVVNRGQHEAVWAALTERGVPREAVTVTALGFSDVPEAIRGMHAGAFFLTDQFGNVARAPTRLAELLGCGVPCLIRDGIGDAGRIVESAGVGVVVDSGGPEEVRDAAVQLMALARDPAVRARCVETARRVFSLDRGVRAYDILYRQLAAA